MELTEISARFLFTDEYDNDIIVHYDITDLRKLGIHDGKTVESGLSFTYGDVEYTISEIYFVSACMYFPNNNMPSGCDELSPSKGYNLDIRILVKYL